LILQEIGVRHVAAPSISAAHQLRIISANRTERLKVVKNLGIPQPSKSRDEDHSRDEIIEIIRKATYGAIFGAFVMGLNLIARASEDEVRRARS
jgi:6-phosphogluconate dehydrogenase